MAAKYSPAYPIWTDSPVDLNSCRGLIKNGPDQQEHKGIPNEAISRWHDRVRVCFAIECL